MPKWILILGLLHWLVIAAIVTLAVSAWHVGGGWVALGLFLYFVFFMQVLVRWLRHSYHFPIPEFITPIIDNPIRRTFMQNPDTIARHMQLSPGMTVVEIGPGNGSYTRSVAAAIQPGGRLYAIDISERVVERLKARFRKGVTNVVPKIEDAHHFSFSDASVDRVFAVSCLPGIPDPVKVLEECRRILKPDGLACFCKFIIDPDYPLRSTEKRWAEKAGLILKQEFGNWFSYQLHFTDRELESRTN